jgi:arginine repressor
VVGTIAGDDTVLVIATDKKKAQSLAQRIRDLS